MAKDKDGRKIAAGALGAAGLGALGYGIYKLLKEEEVAPPPPPEEEVAPPPPPGVVPKVNVLLHWWVDEEWFAGEVEFAVLTKPKLRLTFINDTNSDWFYTAELYYDNELHSTIIADFEVGRNSDRIFIKTVSLPSEPGEHTVAIKITETITDTDLGFFNFVPITIVGAEFTVSLTWDDNIPQLTAEPLTTHTANIHIKNITDMTWSPLQVVFQLDYSVDVSQSVWKIALAPGEEKLLQHTLKLPNLFPDEQSREALVTVNVDTVGYSEVFEFPPVVIKTAPVPTVSGSITWETPPPFSSGSQHTAIITVRNPDSVTRDYEISFWFEGIMVPTWPARFQTGNIAAGQSKSWNIPVTMPTVLADAIFRAGFIVKVKPDMTQIANISTTVQVKAPPAPPPPEMLSAPQMKTVLDYVWCGHMKDPERVRQRLSCTASASLGPSLPIVLASPCGFLVSIGDSIRRACADAVAAKVTTNPTWRTLIANYLYYPSTEAQIGLINLGDAIAVEIGKLQERCLMEYCTISILWGTCFPQTRYKVSSGQLTWAQVCPKQPELVAQMDALWAIYRLTQPGAASPLMSEVNTCCAARIAAAKPTLSMVSLQACANYSYNQCLIAVGAIINAYITQWGAPITIDNFLSRVRQLRGDAGVQLAIWAIENLLG